MFRIIVCGMVLILGGCSGGPYPLAPVSGTVTLDGQPLAEAFVAFEPVRMGDGMVAGYGSYGNTDEKGRFTLTTLHNEEGAIVGTHRVSIKTLAGEEGSDGRMIITTQEKVPPRYNFDSELTFDVPPDGTDAADFDLTSD